MDSIDMPVLVAILFLVLAVRFSGWGRGLWPPREPPW